MSNRGEAKKHPERENNDPTSSDGRSAGNERVMQLEESVCHLQRLHEDLHEVMLGQERDLRTLRSKLDRLEHRLRQFEDVIAEGTDVAEEDGQA